MCGGTQLEAPCPGCGCSHHPALEYVKNDHLVRQVFSRLLCKINGRDNRSGQPDLEPGPKAGSEGCARGGMEAEATF